MGQAYRIERVNATCTGQLTFNRLDWRIKFSSSRSIKKPIETRKFRGNRGGFLESYAPD